MKEIDWKQKTSRASGEETEETPLLHRVRRVVRVRPDGSYEEKEGRQQEVQQPLPESPLLQWARESGQWVPEGLSLSCQCPSGPEKEEDKENRSRIPCPPCSCEPCSCSCICSWDAPAHDYLTGVDPVVGGQQGEKDTALKLALAAQQGFSACMEEDGIRLEKGAYLVLLQGRAQDYSGEEAGLQLLLDGQAVPGGLWRGKETASLGAILATQGAKLQVICLEDGLYQNLSLTVLRLDG